MLLREKLVQCELAAAKLGIHELGGDNHGPWVKKFLAVVGLPEGYAWCDAFQSFEMEGAAGHKLPIESASVGQTYATAQKLGWLASRPARGDLVCFDFDADGQFDDHIGLVVKVLGLGPMLTLQTVEGNTSSGEGGSQANGDGVYLRRRVVSAKRVAFVRIPGEVADPGVPVKAAVDVRGESKQDAPFNTPVPPAAPTREVLSEHGQGQGR